MNQITPAFTVLVVLISFTIITSPKERIVIPIIVAMCFLPADISLKLGTLDFQGLRIIAIVSLFKIYFCPEPHNLKLNTIDKLFIAYNSLGALIYIIASQNHLGAFTYKSGVWIDSVVLYLVLRNIITSNDSLRLIAKTFTICLVILLPFTIFEFYSAQNLFSFLGRSSVAIRNGEIRAAATFSHSILYGSFAAALFPVMWSTLKIQKTILTRLAVISCFFIVFACSSSGPIVALAVTICFLFFFKWKRYSSLLAKAILFMALFIHFVREKPLWHFLYMRLSIKASSTGQHRYLLLDASIKEFWNWWLTGYGDLGPQWHTQYWPWNHARFTDITNHYLLEGVRGGFFTMLLFMILCYKSVKILGTVSISQTDRENQWLWWGYTIMMIAHCVTFLSVAYFGQITMLLFLSIAIAAFALDESNRF